MPLPNPLRVIFAGTPDFAATALQALIEYQAHNDIEIIAVYTQPDRPSGRGQQLKISSVKDVALKHSLPVYQPVNFKQQQDLDTLINLKADLMIVVAYGLLLPTEVLDAPTLGCINIHASLLPRWRGAAPIQRAILAGDTQTGITIMQMNEGLDTGDMLLTKTCNIETDDTASSLHDKLANLGAIALTDALNQLKKNQLHATVQDNAKACYAHKLSKQEAMINWHTDADQIARQIRAFNAWPVAQTIFDNKTIRIWQAHTLNSSVATAKPGEIVEINKNAIHVACQQGCLAITDLQLSGSKRMTVNALLNGRPDLFKVGQSFN